MDKGFKVDFVGIGAGKCGTTWLSDMLRQHPDIFLPKKKELHYFSAKSREGIENRHYGKPLKWYASFFKNAGKDQLKGEFSTSYIWNKNSAKDIYEHNPHVKIIVLLRDPVKNLFSRYNFWRQRGIIHSNFDQILDHKELLSRSLYSKELERYFALFPKGNILVMFFDDLKNSIKFLTGVEEFLEVKQWIPPNVYGKSHVTGVPKIPYFNSMIISANRFLVRRFPLAKKCLRLIGVAWLLENIRIRNKKPFGKKPVMNPVMEEKLRKFYHKDITNLEKLLGRDLSHWK